MSAVSLGQTAVVAQFAPKKRTFQPVRRNSYEVGSHRAKVSRIHGRGDVNDEGRWYRTFLETLDEWIVETREPGKGIIVPFFFSRVMAALVRSADWKTGDIEPSLVGLALMAGCCKQTVVDCIQLANVLEADKDFGFLSYVRRCERAEDEDGGFQWKQATNAYTFTPERWPQKFYDRFQEKLKLKRRRSADMHQKALERASAKTFAPLGLDEPKTATSPKLKAVRAALERCQEAAFPSVISAHCESTEQADTGISPKDRKE
ncbi:hypothetical protein WBP07_12790 [Novosphingobium sp. BL-8A]|uniref:hypothetical protein n=1 Tax=Novosphingobium sp. BL-8A TaxID=3127639 RepID=UPI0037583710